MIFLLPMLMFRFAKWNKFQEATGSRWPCRILLVHCNLGLASLPPVMELSGSSHGGIPSYHPMSLDLTWLDHDYWNLWPMVMPGDPLWFKKRPNQTLQAVVNMQVLGLMRKSQQGELQPLVWCSPQQHNNITTTCKIVKIACLKMDNAPKNPQRNGFDGWNI